MARVSFIVDGFNVYHSLLDARRDLGDVPTKWLDLDRLLRSYLPMLGPNPEFADIYYFSAFAKHLLAVDADVVTRHQTYVSALQSTGVHVEMGRFKPKDMKCKATCREMFKRHEEKYTDVAMSAKLFEIFHTDTCDVAVIVTGDTDLVPAVKTAQRLFPAKEICFGFPHRRSSVELKNLVSRHFRLKANRYTATQFPDPIALGDGASIAKPASW